MSAQEILPRIDKRGTADTCRRTISRLFDKKISTLVGNTLRHWLHNSGNRTKPTEGLASMLPFCSTNLQASQGLFIQLMLWSNKIPRAKQLSVPSSWKQTQLAPA